MPGELLEARGVTKAFPARTARGAPAWFWAVRDVDVRVARDETLGLVGESGCGKSTLARCLLRLLPTTRGRISFDGIDLTHLSSRRLRPLRRRMQIVFQDPVSSLNPRLTVAAALGEPLRVHRLATPAALPARTEDLLRAVGLEPDLLARYPHELSGGERQRVAIARALAVEPELLVADEPVSALDVSVQAQVLNLFASLRRTHGLTYLFISHDLRVVRLLSDRVAIMLGGRIVETGPTAEIFAAPRHPYTRQLLADMPGSSDAPPLGGAPTRAPVSLGDDTGCGYRERCPEAVAVCAVREPALQGDSTGHAAACHAETRAPDQTVNPPSGPRG